MTDLTPQQQVEYLHAFHVATRQPDKDHLAKLNKQWTGKDGKPKSMQLDYVGHADATDMLLSQDPLWNWEPPTRDELDLLGYESAIIRDSNGWPRGMWIALTVFGHRRLGFGTCEAGKADAIKELIGDAIRNASMRFGLALVLWSKAEWDDEPPVLSTAAPSLPGESGGGGPVSPTPMTFDFRPMMIACRELGLPDELRHRIILHLTDGRSESVKEMTGDEAHKFAWILDALKNNSVPRLSSPELMEAIRSWRRGSVDAAQTSAAE